MQIDELIFQLQGKVSFKAISAAMIRLGFKFLSCGVDATVWYRSDCDLIVKANRYIPFPDIAYNDKRLKRLFLQPLWMRGDRMVCIVHKAEDVKSPKAFKRAARLSKLAEAIGIKCHDIRYANVGTYKGKWYIIDYGCYIAVKGEYVKLVKWIFRSVYRKIISRIERKFNGSTELNTRIRPTDAQESY